MKTLRSKMLTLVLVPSAVVLVVVALVMYFQMRSSEDALVEHMSMEMRLT